MTIIWDDQTHPAPITQARARVIASEICLTWRQVIWTINQAELESRQRASLHHWLEEAPADEVSDWVFEQWVHQAEQAKNCDYGKMKRN